MEEMEEQQQQQRQRQQQQQPLHCAVVHGIASLSDPRHREEERHQRVVELG
jgi:hypothetical protein